MIASLTFFKRTIPCLLGLFCLLIIPCSVSFGQNISVWPFGATGLAPNPVPVNAVGANAAYINAGASTILNSGAGNYECSQWNNTTLDLARYFEVSVSPAANYNMTVTQFSMNLQNNNNTTGAKNYEVRISNDNFSTSASIGMGSTITSSFTTIPVAINGIARSTNTLSVRVYFWGATDGTRVIRISNATILGTVQRPVLTRSTASLSGFLTTQGVPSAAQSYVVSGNSLVGNATLTAPSGYEISTSLASGFGSTLTLPNTSGVVANTTIYVRLTGAAQGSFSGNVSNASTDAVTLNVALSGSVQASLPVELVSFHGKPVANRVQLNWATAWERFADRFVVQRSRDAAEFADLGTLTATGNTNGQRTYMLTDEQPTDGANYYRLKQIDQDGSVSYSKTIAVVVRTDQPSLVVYPNPSDGRLLQLQVRDLVSPSVTLQMVNGEIISGKWLQLTNAEASWQPDVPLSPGLYVMTVSDGAIRQAVKVLVQ